MATKHGILGIGSCIFLLLMACSAPPTTHYQTDDWREFFHDELVIGTIVIADMNSDEQWIASEERAKTGFLPASTYKIINSMIGLETGVITPTDTIVWNGDDYWNDDWEKNHVLASAFRVSCVPCYQQIARKIGTKRMVEYTAKVPYGTMDIHDENIDNFWLVGDSKITPLEQVNFINRLYFNDLPFSDSTMNSVKEIMILEEQEGFTLRGKTGWAQTDSLNTGWFVGYLETSDAAYAFATNIERNRTDGSDGFSAARKNITMRAFKDLKIID